MLMELNNAFRGIKTIDEDEFKSDDDKDNPKHLQLYKAK
jgi:hypothetical protein